MSAPSLTGSSKERNARAVANGVSEGWAWSGVVGAVALRRLLLIWEKKNILKMEDYYACGKR
ncbi:hypothetical protein [Treponema sp. R80B11-R83G3]